MATQKENYTTGDDSFRSCYGANVFIGQTFTTTSAYRIGSVKLKLYRVGNPGTLTLSIQGTSADLPDDSDLVSGTYSGNTLTDDSGGEWAEFTFSSGYELTDATKYAIVLKAASGDASNYVAWRADNSSPSYSGGVYVYTTSGAGNWQAGAAFDMMFDNYTFLVSSVDDKVYSKKLVAIGNNEVWHESSSGTMEELSAANGDIDCSTPLNATEAFQKIFIVNGTNLKVADFVNTKISTADAGANPCTHGMELTGTGGGKMIVDYASGVTDDAAALVYGYTTTTQAILSTDTMTGTNGDGDAVSFVIDAPVAEASTTPHWYDWTPFGNDTTTYGEMPSSAYIICRYRGRLIIGGHPDYPHQWYACKVADPWNWLYASNNALTAITGQNADAGELGDVLRALIPYGDDYMVMGAAHSMYLMTGDPASGGSIDELSDHIGIYGPKSWVKDTNGNLYFLGTNGLYKMEGGRSKPVNISIGVMPKFIEDWALTPGTHIVTLSYDPVREGIGIHKTATSDGSNENYWFSLKTQGFYPETYPKECGIYSYTFNDSDSPTYKYPALGCRDGYIRCFKETSKDDDIGGSDEAISSYVTLPSMPLGDGMSYGKLRELVFESAGGASSGDYSDTDGFSYAVYQADDAETLLEDIRDGGTGNFSGTISGTGRSSYIRTKLRGRYGTIKLSNSTAAQTWAINRVLYNRDIAGK